LIGVVFISRRATKSEIIRQQSGWLGGAKQG
jgi:hypothetical protein